MAVSIHDVAKRAGVSISTVSRIMNNSANVNEKKVAAVKEAMDYYHYEPNSFGRGLVKQQSNMIGIYFPSQGTSIFESTYNMGLLKGIERVLPYQNYSMVLINETAEYTSQKLIEPKYLEYIRQRRIDGIILSGLNSRMMKDTSFKELVEEEYPMVYIGKRVHLKGLNVYAQFEQYHLQMIEELHTNGHKRILLMVAPRHLQYINSILKQAAERMPEVEIKSVMLDEFTQEREHLLQVVSRYVTKEAFTAICSPGMEITQLLLSICAQLKLEIPEQVSLISVEHRLGEGALLYPQISAFYVPAIDMGSGATDLLIKTIRGEKISEKSIEFETQYIKRDSVGSV